MQTLRTGELARRANVNIETLRFYERKGLLPKPPQRASGYREYPPEAVELVQFIKRAQLLGFALREVTELLDLRQVPRATCGDVVVLARRKIEEIDAKMSDLRALRMALTKLLKGCTGTAPIAQCPIIESLVNEPKPQGKPRLASGKGEEKLHGNRHKANCCR
jgi:Hg(II)-responsive transcriptional regulator